MKTYQIESIKLEVENTLSIFNCSLNFYSDICKDMTMQMGNQIILFDYSPYHDDENNVEFSCKIFKKVQRAELNECKLAIRKLIRKHNLRFSHYEVKHTIVINHFGNDCIEIL